MYFLHVLVFCKWRQEKQMLSPEFNLELPGGAVPFRFWAHQVVTQLSLRCDDPGQGDPREGLPRLLQGQGPRLTLHQVRGRTQPQKLGIKGICNAPELPAMVPCLEK